MDKHENKIQTSETFLLSSILTLSGGFQDAYTYALRDEVFANAQTGNVILMSQHFMAGEWYIGLQYLLPIVAFALGVLLAEMIEHSYKRSKFHWRQIVVLLEVVILFMVGFIPTQYNTMATMLVSFACAMQVQSFRKMLGFTYASTMCIGNLRSGTSNLSVYLRDRKVETLKRALCYYGIIFIFAIGAVLGGICSGILGLKAIWISSLFLMLACALMVKKYR
ncbi:YoaK family protein [Cellulosilyticum ruminicola]|uniref:YoaK family protein n=1 Tax=Cellulosilyticum ruminicola TaxID=425254 RepID=UPI0006D0F178|nr:YoaK family protein [Cellulosilyticum ruminicola]